MLSPDMRSTITIDRDEFRSTLRFIRPGPDELGWQSIPWQTDLFEAMRLARKEGKPVLLWTMNGNPLGCT